MLKTCKRLDNDELLESNMAMAHYLRQLCDTPDKQEWLTDFLSSQSSLSPAVIFYNYQCEAKSICEAAKKAGRGKIWLINGESHDIPTAETVKPNDVIVAQYLSGGEGLNLQFCNYMVMYSYNYSYSTSTQARGRIRRIGQQKPQFFYYLRCDKTIEIAIEQCLKSKSDFAEVEWLASQGVNLDERKEEKTIDK